MAEAAGATPGSEAAAPAVASAEAAPAAVAAAPAAEAPATLLGGDPPADVAAAPAGETKPEAKTGADGLPETYNVTIPEGETVDAPRLEAYQGALKEAKLTQAQADALTPFLLGQIKQLQTEQMSAWADTTKAWRTSVESDPEIGGAKLRESLTAAARARDQFGGPELKALLADSNLGIGNHPAIVKLLANVGRQMGEDLRGADKQAGGAQPGERDRSPAAIGARMGFRNSLAS